MADDGGESRVKHLLGNQPVRVRDIGNLEVCDEREVEGFEFPGKGEPAGEDERVTELDRIDMGSTGMGNGKCLLFFS